MGLLTPRPDEDFVPTAGGLLDGLPGQDSGSSLDLFMRPEEIAQIDGLGNENRGAQPLQESGPMPQEAGDNSPPTAEDRPQGAGGEDRGSIAGKIWNLPNTAIGLGYGGLGYLAGWPSKWLGLQENAPGITIGNNAVQFTDNPFGGVGAITLGNAQVMNGKPTDMGSDHNLVGPHEEQHTYQGEQLGPLYLPSNVFGGLAGVLIDGNWHGPHNWNEVGPQHPSPVPWPK